MRHLESSYNVRKCHSPVGADTRKVEKLDSIENALEKIEAKLENLESRTKLPEDVQHGNEHEIAVLEDNIRTKEKNLEDVTAKQAASETELANLARQIRALEKKIDDLHTKNLNLEAYSRRENIKFMNGKETAKRDQREDTEQVLANFLQQELGFLNARDVEMQRVYRVGKSREGKPRPIFARFLRCQDCEKLIALGRHLHGT